MGTDRGEAPGTAPGLQEACVIIPHRGAYVCGHRSMPVHRPKSL